MRRCGHPTLQGTPCQHMVSTPRRPDCGRHAHIQQMVAESCKMELRDQNDWFCSTHMGNPAWEAAAALGAGLPCRIPLPRIQLEMLAQSGDLSTSAAIMLAQSSVDVQRILSSNPWCPRAAWPILAASIDHYVLEDVASRAPTLDIVRRFAQDQDPILRFCAACNKACPPDTIRQLAKDSDLMVCKQIAMRTDLPSEVGWALKDHPSDQVRRSLALYCTWQPLLEWLAEHDPDPDIRHIAAHRRG